MPCPILLTTTLGVTTGGVRSLVVDDVRGRKWSLAMFALLMTAWAVYFGWYRDDLLRWILEGASVLAIAAGLARSIHLHRTGQSVAGPAALRHPWVQQAMRALRAPETLLLQVLALGMIGLDAMRLVGLPLWAHGLANTLLAVLVVRRIVADRPSARSSRRAALRSFAAPAPHAHCPFGFGPPAPTSDRGTA